MDAASGRLRRAARRRVPPRDRHPGRTGRRCRLPGQHQGPQADRPPHAPRVRVGRGCRRCVRRSSSRRCSWQALRWAASWGPPSGKVGNIATKSDVAKDLADVITPGTSGIVAVVDITAVDAVKDSIPEASEVKAVPIDKENCRQRSPLRPTPSTSEAGAGRLGRFLSSPTSPTGDARSAGVALFLRTRPLPRCLRRGQWTPAVGRCSARCNPRQPSEIERSQRHRDVGPMLFMRHPPN